MCLATVVSVSLIGSTVLFVTLCSNPDWFGSSRPVPNDGGNEKAREFHNERIYDNYKLFITLILGILAGAGFLLSQGGQQARLWQDREVQGAVGFIILSAGWIPSLLVLGHRLGKLKREGRTRAWWRHVASGEWVMFAGMITVTHVTYLFSCQHC